MEGGGGLPSLTPMSRSSPAPHQHDPKDSPNSVLQNSEELASLAVNSNDILAVSGGTSREGDRVKRKARKRKSTAARYRIGYRASKRRRLGTSSSKASRKKAGALQESSKAEAIIPIPPDPSAREASENSKVLAEGAGEIAVADLAYNLVSKFNDKVLNKGCEGEDLSKKAADVETRTARDLAGAHLNNAKLGRNLESGPSLPTSKFLGSGEQTARRKENTKQDTTDQRVLRPRRQTQAERRRAVQSIRVLKDVALSLADSQRILGRRIKVFWPLDEKWYYGVVKDYDASKQLHKVIYDDHDEEWLSLQKEKFKLQIFPGEAFGQMGSTGGSPSAQISPEEQQESVAAASGKTAQQVNGLKGASAGGDVLLRPSELSRDHRVEGALGKGECNGPSKSGILSQRNDVVGPLKNSASPASGIITDGKGARKTLLTGAIGDSNGSAAALGQDATCTPAIKAKVRKVHEGEASSVDKSGGRLSAGKDILPRAGSAGRASTTNDPGLTNMGKSACVYVRRHINRTEVRAPIAEAAAGLSHGDGKATLSQSGRTITNGAPEAGGRVSVGPGSLKRHCPVEQAQRSSSGSRLQSQTSERNAVVSIVVGLPFIAAQPESGASGNVGFLGSLSSIVAPEEKEGQPSEEEAGGQIQQTVSTLAPEASHPISGRRALQSSSSGLTYHDVSSLTSKGAGLLDGKKNLDHQDKVSSDVRVLGTRVCSSSNSVTSTILTTVKESGFGFQRGRGFQQRPLVVSSMRLELHPKVPSAHEVPQHDMRRAFLSTIHLLRPDVPVPDLFTRQLFNILKRVGLCDGDSIEERFSMNGSFQDFLGIVRLLLVIVKSLPLCEWICQRRHWHWQNIILKKLWNVLSGSEPWFSKLIGVLPAKDEEALVRHLRYFISEVNSVNHMTFRLMLNILVCCFLKPYVIATICESGALHTAVFQHCLLPERKEGHLQGAIQFVRQSLRPVGLRSGAERFASVEVDFAQAPVFKDWHTGNGLFQNHGNKWIATSSGIGRVEQSCITPSVKLPNHMGLQLTPIHVGAREGPAGSPCRVFYLKQNGGSSDGVLSTSIVDCLRLAGEVREEVLDGRFGFRFNYCESPHLFSGLLLTSMLQRRLYLAGSESLSVAEVSPGKEMDIIYLNSGLPSRVSKSILEGCGAIVPSQNGRRNAKGIKRSLSQCEKLDATEVDRGEGNKKDLRTVSSTIYQAPKRTKLEAEPNVSVRSSSSESLEFMTQMMTVSTGLSGITPAQFPPVNPRTSPTLYSCPSGKSPWHVSGDSVGLQQDGLRPVGAVKDEIVSGINGSLVKDRRMPFQNTSKDTSHNHLLNDAGCLGSGSPASFGNQATLSPSNSGENGVGFRLQANGDRFFDPRGKEPWIDPKVASFYNRVLDRRKRKRDIPKLVCPVYTDASHLRSRRHVKRGRPSRQSRQERVAEQISPYCSANLLITEVDRGWRELDVRVELQSFNGSECMIAVQVASGRLYTHKVQQSTPTGTTNRHTHAMMWKGGNGWILEFPDRKQWNIFKGMYEECGHRNARAASVKQIPIPGVRQLEDSDVVNLQGCPFLRPPYMYICQVEGEVEAALKSTCNVYDMDSDDEAWLAQINVRSDNVECSELKPWISEEVLEKIMDKLEKVSYMRQKEPVAADAAVEICQDLGSADTVRAVHAHWSAKRQNKGTALVRQFQPPPWEQYQKQVQNWQASLNELQLRLPTAGKEQLLEQCVRPPMFAFCLRPRGLDVNSTSKKMQKQRSQKKLSSGFKVSRQGASSLFEPSIENHMARQDMRGRMDKMLGFRTGNYTKLSEETSPDSLTMDCANSSFDAQTCSSAGTGVSLFDQSESSEQSFQGARLERQRSSLKKTHRKAKRMRMIVAAEELPRTHMLRPQRVHAHQQLLNSPADPDWQPTSRLRSSVVSGCRTIGWQKSTLQPEIYEQPVSGLGQETSCLDPLTMAEEAQTKAAAARAVAGIKAAKSQRQFLKFDSALQRAVAALIEFEVIRSAEQAVGDQDSGGQSPSVPNEQLCVLKQKVGLLSSQLSTGLGKEAESVDASKGAGLTPISGPGQVRCGNVKNTGETETQTEELEEADPKLVLIGDADALLPMPRWGQLDAWLGTTLLQRTDKNDEVIL